jgi:hypothetical protein
MVIKFNTGNMRETRLFSANVHASGTAEQRDSLELSPTVMSGSLPHRRSFLWPVCRTFLRAIIAHLSFLFGQCHFLPLSNGAAAYDSTSRRRLQAEVSQPLLPLWRRCDGGRGCLLLVMP